jgi:hypothetical protein
LSHVGNKYAGGIRRNAFFVRLITIHTAAFAPEEGETLGGLALSYPGAAAVR